MCIRDLRLFKTASVNVSDGHVTTRDLSPVAMANRDGPAVERASSADLAFLAMDTGQVPQQFAVVLILERPGDFSLSHLRKLIADRIVALPRMRQKLIKVPPGCGRPVWVDDGDFNIDHHVQAVSCPPPGDQRALLETVLSVIMTPLPRGAPLWSVALISDLADGGVAVVVVLHHVLADGLGGLECTRGTRRPGTATCPRPLPTGFADTGASCTRRDADAVPRLTPGDRFLAIAAPGNVRWRRFSPNSSPALLARATDGSASEDGSRQGGSRCAESSSASIWGYHERRNPRRRGWRAASVFAEQRRVNRAHSHHRAGLRPPTRRRVGGGKSREPDAGQHPDQRGCR